MINNMQEWATNKGRVDEMIVHNGCVIIIWLILDDPLRIFL